MSTIITADIDEQNGETYPDRETAYRKRFQSAAGRLARQRYKDVLRETHIKDPWYWVLDLSRNELRYSEFELYSTLCTEEQYERHMTGRRQAFEKASPREVIGLVRDGAAIECLHYCRKYFIEHDCFEESLVNAWTRSDMIHMKLGHYLMGKLLRRADQDRLRAAGDAIPEGDTFTIYRGCSGGGVNINAARECFSWTHSLDVAEWFAIRWQREPVIYRTTIQRQDIVFYNNRSHEMEIVTQLPASAQIDTIEHSGRSIDDIRSAFRPLHPLWEPRQLECCE